ncbi:MAG: aminotransferase class V-fold PLP-dependent enzyme [Clostridia bacterium]|nr:aminotransferase class V-fold PLP-dependent enzyme [Clostridia bacterium]
MKTPEKFLRERENFPVFEKYAYLLAGETGPIPNYVYNGVKDYMDRRYLEGGDAIFRGEGTFTMIARVRGVFAKLLGCQAEDIAFGPNSSAMFCIFSDGLVFEPGDNIVTSRDTFISMAYALDMLRKEGLEIRYVESEDGVVPTEAILAACDERTKAVSLCLVESSTGYRHDIAAIGEYCRAHGIWLAVDAVHAVGILPVDVEKMKIDFLCGGDYKWMMNFCGTGYAYVSPALRDALKNRRAGWLSVKQLFVNGLFEADLADGASRYELGYPFAPGIFAMGEVAARYLELGPEEIEAHVLSLADYFYEKAAAIPGVTVTSAYPEGHRSALGTNLVPGDKGVTVESLRERGVCVTVHEAHSADEQTSIRASFHYVNTYEDVDKLVEALRSLLV